jgi:membrane protein implicated in regulation of membrane protease activity
MPLDRFVLLIVIVLAAGGLTVTAAAWVSASAQLPWLGLAMLLPAGMVAYVLVRVISDRLRNRDDDHYDRIDR